MKLKLKRILSLVLAAAAIMSLMAIGVSADQFNLRRKADLNMLMQIKDEKGEIVPAKGEVGLYCIALTRLVNADQFYMATAGFMGASIEFTNIFTEEDVLKKVPVPILEEHIAKYKLKPKYISEIDEKGNVNFHGLSAGLYLVTPVHPKNAPQQFSMNSFLVTLPRTNGDGSYDYSCAEPMLPKVELTPSVCDIQVVKEWKKDEPKNRPENIIVDLMNDGLVADTAILDAKNGWQWIFQDKPAYGNWTVQERKVEGYEGEVGEMEINGNTYRVVITNTLLSNDPLKQTGQLNWPVPVLIIGGLMLIGCGFVLSRDKKKY